MKTSNRAKTLLLVIISWTCMMTNAVAQRLEIDEKSAQQIIENTAIAGQIETMSKDTLKTSSKRNDSIAAMTSSITVLRTIYHEARKNTKGFGNEAAINKMINAKIMSIIPKVGVAVNMVMKNPASSANIYQEVLKIYSRINNIASIYSKIITNGKEPNLLNLNDKGGDGLNYLSQRDRYLLSCSLLDNLRQIDWYLTVIIYAAQQKYKAMDVIRGVDFYSWCVAWKTKYTAESIIHRLENLGK